MQNAIRRIGSAALVGLPAALLAHALVFQGEHTLGGSMHGAVLELGAVFAFLGTLLAASGAVRRWRFFSLNYAGIALGAASWFGAIELCERTHGIPFLFAAAAVLFAAWLVRAVLLAFARTIVAIVAIVYASIVAAQPRITSLAYDAPPAAQSIAHRLRLFSRPPPVFS